MYKYLENKINKYDNLLDNVITILGEIVKNMEMNQKQKKLFYTLFRMLNVKDEKILSIIDNDNKNKWYLRILFMLKQYKNFHK